MAGCRQKSMAKIVAVVAPEPAVASILQDCHS